MFNGGEFSKILDEIFEKDEKEKEKAIETYCKIWKYLENITLKNLKYKRAFEILKKYKLFILKKDKEIDFYEINTLSRAEWLENEEYELLEELMKDE